MLKIPKLLHLVIIRGKTEWSVANILIGTPRDITFRPMINQAEEKYVYHFVCLFMPWWLCSSPPPDLDGTNLSLRGEKRTAERERGVATHWAAFWATRTLEDGNNKTQSGRTFSRDRRKYKNHSDFFLNQCDKYIEREPRHGDRDVFFLCWCCTGIEYLNQYNCPGWE